ncbi:ankyrin repeat-containing domain protein [Podospora aff. communis PSN243]|uniref:Ankyrin repeat-containing domain protein n=1 Tax=Podospora aff. communis PSN243 TaxID=3040156 RepID=A0AAV9GDB1_9PEZI|nr:ankyrin repeat-containing domain protein [Podospora aff. communis PSN243]
MDSPSEREPDASKHQTPQGRLDKSGNGSETDTNSLLGHRASRPYSYTRPDATVKSEADGPSQPSKDSPEPDRFETARRPSSYVLPGRVVISSRTTLASGKPATRAEPSTKRRSVSPGSSVRGCSTKEAPYLDSNQEKPNSKQHGPTGPRPQPTWLYRKQRYVTPLYQTGTKSDRRLAEAARWGSLDSVKDLLEGGAHLESSEPPPRGPRSEDSASPPRDTALTMAVQRPSNGFEIAKFLLECGADVNKAELKKAVDRDDVEMTRLLLEYGYPMFYPVGYWLNRAVDLGSIELCELFLEFGANVNSQDMKGSTALLQAAWQGREAIVDLLLREGASVHLICRNGQTALYKASGQGHEGTVQRLLESGARPDEGRGAYGETALFKAVSKGHTGVVKRLLDSGADPNIPNDHRRRAWIGDDYRKGNFSQLLASGYYTNLSSHWMNPALEKYIRQQFQPQKACQYPLHAVAENKENGVAMAKELMAAGARVNVEDGEGMRPIDYAVVAGFKGMVKLLESRGSGRSNGGSRGNGESFDAERAVKGLMAEAAIHFLSKKRDRMQRRSRSRSLERGE